MTRSLGWALLIFLCLCAFVAFWSLMILLGFLRHA